MDSLLNKRLLGSCSFDDEDDISYLRNDVAWIDSKTEALSDIEAAALFKLVQRTQRLDIEMISSRFAKRVLTDYFEKEFLEELTPERRSFLKCLFLAAVVRELIIRNETYSRMEDARTLFLQRYPFLMNQEGSNTELTWLNRFERAMRYTSLILPPKGNKKNYIDIATHLQGSDVFTQYIPGGANPPTTQRRVDIFIHLTGVEVVKRATPRNMTPKTPSNASLIAKRGRGRPRKNPLMLTPSPQPVNNKSVFNYSNLSAYLNHSHDMDDSDMDEDDDDDDDQFDYNDEMTKSYTVPTQNSNLSSYMTSSTTTTVEAEEDEVDDILNFFASNFVEESESTLTTTGSSYDHSDHDNQSATSHQGKYFIDTSLDLDCYDDALFAFTD